MTRAEIRTIEYTSQIPRRFDVIKGFDLPSKTTISICH